jgi:hypothetical protein
VNAPDTWAEEASILAVTAARVHADERARRCSTPVRSVVPENVRMAMKGGMSVRP